MDIFQRTCKKEGVVVPEKEVEVTEAEATEETLAEEEEEEPEEPLDVDALQRELECMKRRIQQLQLRLKVLKKDECPKQPCVDYEIELNCSENKEICALQKNQHKLQCQIEELVSCCRFAKDQIEDLQLRMCEKSRQVMQLQQTVASLTSWRNTLEHEFGVCIERFEYLKHVKAEWKPVKESLNTLYQSQLKNEKTYLPKETFWFQRKEITREVDELQDYFQEVFDLHVQRFVHLEQLLLQKIKCEQSFSKRKERVKCAKKELGKK